MVPVNLKDLQRLAGIPSQDQSTVCLDPQGSNISLTAAEKVRLQKEHNIQPGTPEWFQLWFSLPYLTGEKPIK